MNEILHDDDEDLIPAPQMRREMGGISAMTEWRWSHNAALGFPQPLVINRRKYYARGKIREFRARLEKPEARFDDVTAFTRAASTAPSQARAAAYILRPPPGRTHCRKRH